MRRCSRGRLFAQTWLLGLLASTLAGQARIACLGDSITFGARLPERNRHSYPAQLQALRPADEVRNFGVGGATLLLLGDRPYAARDAFERAVAWQPDVAIIMLGTNDTCQQGRRNWEHCADLASSARLLCRRLLAGSPDMRIVLSTPPAMFPSGRALSDQRRANLETRAPRLASVATALRLVAADDPRDRIDYLELRTTLRAGDVVDGVHPNPFGAERIARRMHELLQARPLRGKPPIASINAWLTETQNAAAEPAQFHGFEGIKFSLPATSARCKVFAPHMQAAGAPWIWRARFFGHQPALDIALLERGFHLVYCDVANLYGSDEALVRWDECYDAMTRAGLGPRAVLEGMSRGGLPIIHWAARHPERIAAIYGDNPVADFRSWPGGTSGKRSDRDWQRCLAAYGLDESAAANYDRMPIDRLAPLAAAQVPLLLVLGMADQVVPGRENGELLATRYAALGGPVEVWRKPGDGHHPHGLHPVDPLLRAVLRAAGQAQRISTTAAPSAENRKGAGWGGDSWHAQVGKMRQLAAQHPHTRLVFFGDSITQGLTGVANRRATVTGNRAIDRTFGQHGALSLGLSGDRTEHLLYRIEHGALQELEPKVIVLQIGVNNVVTGRHTAGETTAGIAAVLQSLRTHEPQAHVLVCGPFPARKKDSPTRRTIDAIHARLAELCRAPIGRESSNVHYLDLRSLFVDDDGACNDNMRSDRIHVTAAGQTAWLEALQPHVDSLLAATKDR